ncbi:MAG: hypothetical protein KGY68_08695, partial [Candidatus Thermoplasmatota archaeon]|nr:hypothetical protein [Candidatus Thermoplasmatota archaeon]
DYKTDRSMVALDEYKKQLSIYYHVVKEEYEEKKVAPYVYYTKYDEMKEIDPLSKEDIYQIVKRK